MGYKTYTLMTLMAVSNAAFAWQPVIYPIRSQSAYQRSVDSAMCYATANKQTKVNMAHEAQTPPPKPAGTKTSSTGAPSRPPLLSQYFFRDATRHRDSRRHGARSTHCSFRCEARYGNGRRRKQCGFRDTRGSGERSAQRDRDGDRECRARSISDYAGVGIGGNRRTKAPRAPLPRQARRAPRNPAWPPCRLLARARAAHDALLGRLRRVHAEARGYASSRKRMRWQDDVRRPRAGCRKRIRRPQPRHQ